MYFSAFPCLAFSIDKVTVQKVASLFTLIANNSQAGYMYTWQLFNIYFTAFKNDSHHGHHFEVCTFVTWTWIYSIWFLLIRDKKWSRSFLIGKILFNFFKVAKDHLVVGGVVLLTSYLKTKTTFLGLKFCTFTSLNW